MEKIEDRPVYKCSYCGKLSLSHGGMTRHELLCKKNPDNWTDCASCEYLDRVSKRVEGTSGERCKTCPHHDMECGCDLEDTQYCDGARIVTDFVCAKTGKRMYYRRKILAMPKAKAEEIIKRCDCPMPCECGIYEKIDSCRKSIFDDAFSDIKSSLIR